MGAGTADSSGGQIVEAAAARRAAKSRQRDRRNRGPAQSFLFARARQKNAQVGVRCRRLGGERSPRKAPGGGARVVRSGEQRQKRPRTSTGTRRGPREPPSPEEVEKRDSTQEEIPGVGAEGSAPGLGAGSNSRRDQKHFGSSVRDADGVSRVPEKGVRACSDGRERLACSSKTASTGLLPRQSIRRRHRARLMTGSSSTDRRFAGAGRLPGTRQRKSNPGSKLRIVIRSEKKSQSRSMRGGVQAAFHDAWACRSTRTGL